MNAPDTPFALDSAVSAAVDRIEPKVIAWRRDIHQNPELGNRELRTSRLIAEHLRGLKVIEVREKIAHTGVIGILRGALPGPVVALRADIDALPVEEQVDVAAIFGLHVTSNHHTGQVGYRVGPLMASSDTLRVFLRGVQTHGAMPWRGIDPVVVSAQVVLGLQTIVSRRMEITREPSVVTVGSIHGGNRDNIIPDD